MVFGCCGFPVSLAPEQLFQTFPSPPAPRGLAPSLSDDLTSYVTQELEASQPELPQYKSLLEATPSKVSRLEMPRGWSWHQQCTQLSGTPTCLFHKLPPPGSHTHTPKASSPNVNPTHTRTHAHTSSLGVSLPTSKNRLLRQLPSFSPPTHSFTAPQKDTASES